MFGWFKKRNIEEAPVSHLTDEEREELITSLECERDALIQRIESLMKKVQDQMGGREYTSRKYAHGRSPNDLEYDK